MWPDTRALWFLSDLVKHSSEGSAISRVVYCAARVNDPQDPGQTQSQGFYLQALVDHGSIDVLEEGYYSLWLTEATMTPDPLASLFHEAV